MKVLLTTLNCKYIHKNLALRWLYVANVNQIDTKLKEYTIKQKIEDIAQDILQEEYDIIACSVYIWNIEETLALIKILKSHTNAKIVFGGPEVSFESFMLVDQGVDALCIGEGEESFWKYVDMICQKMDYDIEGIYTKTNPNTTYSKVQLHKNEMYPNPYFLDIDDKQMHSRYFYFETSRGCPYDCQYCLSSSDTQVRMYSESYIFDILKQISTSNIRVVKLLDRTFNVSPKRALKIARYMNEHCPNQIFQFEIVAETLSEELLSFFEKEADTTRFRFEIGIQSFHEPTLKAVHRYQNNERLLEVLKRLSKANITMHTDLIAGLPFEDYETFKNSYNTLFNLYTSEVQLGILKLLKGTALKRKKDMYDFTYNASPPYDVISTKWLNEQQLKQIQACAYATEKLYNSHRCKYSIDKILQLGLYSDAFTLLQEVGILLKKTPNYQIKDVFCILKQVLHKEDPILVDAILNYDYYRLFKNRIKPFTNAKHTIEEKKQLARILFDADLINQYEMHHMLCIDHVYYEGHVENMVCVYANQSIPKRYIIKDKEIITIHEKNYDSHEQ